MLNRWKGETVTVIAAGPSLTRADAQFARLACKRLIVVNNAWTFARRADALYAADDRWWRSHEAPALDAFEGERWVSARNDFGKTGVPAGVKTVQTRRGNGVSFDEPLYEGSNSAYQAMNLAIMWGATRIIFLGLDLMYGPNGEKHCHADHAGGLSNPSVDTLRHYSGAFEKTAPLLAAAGIEVVNCSPRTALTCFKQSHITKALP